MHTLTISAGRLYFLIAIEKYAFRDVFLAIKLTHFLSDASVVFNFLVYIRL